MDGDTVSVEKTINAPASAIFALLSDAGKHASFDGSGTVVGTKDRPLRLGSKFGMSMKIVAPYKTANEVVEFEPDRLIAWKTSGLGGLVGGRIWRYELEPQGDATLVRETWDISEDKQAWFLRRSAFPKKNEQGIRATLDRIAQTVEHS